MGFWLCFDFKSINCRVLESFNNEDLSVRDSPYYMNPDVFAHIHYNSKVRIFHNLDKIVQHHTSEPNQSNTLILFSFYHFLRYPTLSEIYNLQLFDLLNNNFWKEQKCMKLFLNLLSILIGSTSQYGGVQYHLHACKICHDCL